MKSILCSILLLLFNIIGFCQSEGEKELSRLFSQKMYEAALIASGKMMSTEPTSALPYGVRGGVYVAISKYDSAVRFLQKAVQMDNDTTYISGWAHANLGLAYIQLGNRDKGVAELTRAINLGMTNNSVNFATRILDSIGYDIPEKEYEKDYLPTWVLMEGKNITYNFQDTAGITSAVYRFIKEHEEGYDSLNKIFEAKLPRKMILYIWNDKEIAKKILHTRLGFARPKQCFSHLHRHQTVGHEMTHILSYWAWGTEPGGYSRFINEGIAGFYDLGTYDRLAYARRIIEQNGVRDVMDIWRNEKKIKEKILYPVSAAFVAFLHDNTTTEHFHSIVKGQTIDNVKIILGSRFHSLITEFNQSMGIK
ncbi:MAG: tetratricopeptide repeat protein [Taibaiella sp.]|nr:tetratricopeptide repeat protein [Taibaiella sp.]